MPLHSWIAWYYFPVAMATLHDYLTIINPELNRAKVHKDPNSEYALS